MFLERFSEDLALMSGCIILLVNAFNQWRNGEHLGPPAKSGFGLPSWILQRVGTWRESGCGPSREPWAPSPRRGGVRYATAFNRREHCCHERRTWSVMVRDVLRVFGALDLEKS
ncbi:hypothetical protein TNCV_767431 [Trichonephila clavipes]|nr:hypothetical protein TNCV_767431 [Trichonephila clavipes]